ncbi:MAG: hypothetical protein M3071_07425 [Actinomycetota bacterium]|nr:hypothetical protein [Actinomycetota bacterium]
MSSVAVVVSLMFCGVAWAIPPPLPPQQAVAIVDSGVVWYDDGGVVLVRGDGRRQALLDTPSPPLQFGPPPQIGSSSRAVALFAGTGLLGGLPPSRLTRVPAGAAVGAGGCSSWKPTTASLADFVVARDALVVSAVGACATGPGAAPEPVFARKLPSGRWRVLTWLASTEPPMLAASGDLVAVGVQQSPAVMRVRILDLRTGSTRATLVLPDGYLAFAGPDRLVLSEPTLPSFPIGVTLNLAGMTLGSISAGGSYRVALYSTRGRHLASLGATSEPPIVSGAHLLTVNVDPTRYDQQTIAVRTLPDGPVRNVIGFDAPGRALVTLAFSWPGLALIQTTSMALPTGQYNCRYGTYGPPTAPFLTILDLARRAPFIAPPVTPPQPTPQQVFAMCGPPPP